MIINLLILYALHFFLDRGIIGCPPLENLDDMALPGLNLHELKGKRKGTWSVQVTGNWRVTFKLQKGDVFDVDYEDYH